MKTNRFLLVAASFLCLFSCTSLTSHSDRDPASIAQACSPSQVETPALASLESQVLAKIQAELASLNRYEQEFQHLTLMMSKSRLYSAGFEDFRDPREGVVQSALKMDGGAEWTERLYKLHPELRPTPADDQVQAKAAALINKRRIDEARTLLNQFSNSEAALELRLSARLDLLKSFRFQGDDDLFLQKLEADRVWYKKAFSRESAPTPKAITSYSSYQQALIRGHVRKEKFDQALRETAELKLFLEKTNASAADADWLRGRISDLRNDFESSLAAYETALRELPTEGITQDQALWQLGWTNYKLHRYAAARERWSQLSTTAPAQVLARNEFWTTKSLAAERVQVSERFRALISKYPGTFYATLAKRELGEKFESLSFEHDPCVLAGRVIARMKLKYSAPDVAAFTALYKQRDLPRAKQLLMDMSLAGGLDSSLFLAAALLDDYQPLVLGLPKLTLEEQNDLFKAFPQLFFPNPYASLIERASRESELDPYFALSVIRQESVFAPYALSYADARGLMQVIAKEGERFSTLLGIENYSLARLYEPSVNIPIGTRHLKEGFTANDNSYILTLAAYNAGDEVTQVWRKRLSKDPLEFIEEVPFQETNGYVKAILRNEIYNRALYGHGDFKFPEELLKR